MIVRKSIFKRNHILVPIGKAAKDGYMKIDYSDIWLTTKNCFLYKGYPAYNVSGQPQLVHRAIMNVGKSDTVDHINLEKKDNRRNNLRLASYQQNSINKSPTILNKSGYKGVSFEKQTKKFRADIRHNGKRYNLGRYSSAIDAAKAYDEMALKLHGDFAWLNCKNKGAFNGG